MTTLGKKIQLALDESRMLILGAQILLGFQYRSVFEKQFESLPYTSQILALIALAVLLIAIALMMWPGAYHRIVRDGMDASDVHEFTTTVMDIALLPFMFGLAIPVYVVTARMLGSMIGLGFAIGIGVFAASLWYGLGLFSRRANREDHLNARKERSSGVEKTDIVARVEHVLTEARVVLPGAQALLGFQFATILLEGFDRVPRSSQLIHLGSLLLTAISVVLLMTPAAYHRIVEHGEATEHFHRVASRFIVSAMIPLPLGICGDLFVVVRKVCKCDSLAIFGATIILSVFYGLWFGFTTYRRTQLKRAGA